ncbi:hypothetical protein M409DRAFT_30572 [Zasmidium cellare ATCC 36951]|uniref:Aminoglycoside phosphotransferase domain-containing protein n=1 Tax=Zasmidium cellare ATCC 36951 TaxID=1080233 RepID=A0A6A6BZB6_ZASCE|nr:uncharacterized protein M409DRAFT_30572 [Zasmidium cellare ATCC 36951]KAF2158942.1 hypothetical protein M409DRAFT_30572 [Zasmidium cellare ATCC 36951]
MPSSSAKSYTDLSIEDIIDQCRNPTRECIDNSGKAEIVSFGNVVIKHGKVSAEEIQNQIHAQALLDPAIVRVPRIYSHFSVNGTDYVVMDRICGEKKEVVRDQDTVDRIARIVTHMHNFTSNTPGPVNTGVYSGPLWSEDDQVTLTTKSSLESYVRSRLKRQSNKFTIAVTPLVFTHGDIALRNLIFAEKEIWLLDWEFAGYFPRSAEIAALRLGVGNCGTDLAFHQAIEAAILRERPLSSRESEQVACWLELAVNHFRFYW